MSYSVLLHQLVAKPVRSAWPVKLLGFKWIRKGTSKNVPSIWMSHGLATGYVSWREVCAIRGRSKIIEILAPLLHFEPLKFLCLSKTKEELSIVACKPVPRVLHSLRKFGLSFGWSEKGGMCFVRKAYGSLCQLRLKDAFCKQSKRTLGDKEVFMLNMLGQKRYLCLKMVLTEDQMGINWTWASSAWEGQ